MSNETKHTPGPWKAPQPVGQSQQWTIWADKGGTVVADVDAPNAREREANAHLIAAAPDGLAAARKALAALSSLVDHEPSDGKFDRDWEAAGADDAICALTKFIARAEGKS